LKVANIGLAVKDTTLEVTGIGLAVKGASLKVFDTDLVDSAVLVLVALSLELRGISILETEKDLKL
jgi:hypothetical protein